MSVTQQSSEPSLLETIDFQAFFSTLRLRWWIIPAVMFVSVGLLVAQESRMRTEPDLYRVSKSYQVPNPKAVLSSVGVNPGSIEEFPDSISQLLILASGDTQREISRQIGADVTVTVPISYEIPFIFSCEGPVQSDCLNAIDAYASKASEIRREAMLVGLQILRNVLTELQSVNNDRVTAAKIAGVDALIANLQTDLVQIDTFVEAVTPTIRDVGRVRYVFGLAAGFVIAILIILQLTYTDRRVRSSRQLIRLIGEDLFIGAISDREIPVGDRSAALGLLRGLQTQSAPKMRFVPLRHSPTSATALIRISQMIETSFTISEPFSILSLRELAQVTNDEVDVIIVQRNKDYRKDVVDALRAVRQSGRRCVGFVLLS